MSQSNEASNDDAGEITHIAKPLGAVIIAAARLSLMPLPLPLPARLARLGRELSGETLRPVVVWRNALLVGGTR